MYKKGIIKIYLIILLALLSICVQSKTLTPQQQSEVNGYITIANKFKESNNKNRYAEYINKIAYIYWTANDLPQALTYFAEALTVNKNINNNNALQILFTNIGMIHSDLNEYNEALEYFITAHQYQLLSANKIEIASGLLNIALALEKMKSYEEATEKITEALRISSEQNNLTMIKHCHGRLAQLYKLQNQIDSAKYHLELYTSLSKHEQQIAIPRNSQKINKKTTNNITKLTVSKTHETINFNEYKYKIDLLKKDQIIANLKIKEQNSELKNANDIKIIFYVICILITALLALVYFGFKQSSSNQKETKLLKMAISEIANQTQTPLIIEITNRICATNNAASQILKPYIDNPIETYSFSSLFTADTNNENESIVIFLQNPKMQFPITIFTIDNDKPTIHNTSTIKIYKLGISKNNTQISIDNNVKNFNHFINYTENKLNQIETISEKIIQLKLNNNDKNVAFDIYVYNKKLTLLCNELINAYTIFNKNFVPLFKRAIIEKIIAKPIQYGSLFAKNKDISFKTNISLPPDVKITTDQVLLTQALFHFINNAIAFTSFGEVIFTIEKEGNQIYVEISDTGYGMTQNQLNHLLSNDMDFEQSNGIILSKYIIELLKGKITIYSTEGKGTTISFLLPIDQNIG